MGSTLDKYSFATAKRRIFGSRKTFAIIFAIFIVIGCICIFCEGTSTNTQSFGISLVAGAIISIATLWIEYIRSGEQVRSDELLRSGLLAVYDRRDLVQEYESHVQGCKKIQVAGYTLAAFTESNEQYFRKRASQGDSVKVQMLLVAPDSPWAAAMEVSESKPAGAYKQAYSVIIAKMSGIDGVELRLLERPLPMMIYRIDNFLYTGPYPFSGASRLATTLKLAEDGWWYERQCQEFESLWANAKGVSLT